jgi:hypothetical protein
MSIWGCSSPATSCQPAAAVGFIYCRHSPSPSGFVYLQFSWIHAPFVFSSIQPYPVAIAVPFFRVHVGMCPSSTLVELSTWQPLLQAFPIPRLVGRGCHFCLLWPACLFTGLVRECLSPSLLSSGHPALFVLCLFFLAAYLLFSFLKFFPWVGVSVSRGLHWFVPGGTMCHLFGRLVVSQAG